MTWGDSRCQLHLGSGEEKRDKIDFGLLGCAWDGI